MATEDDDLLIFQGTLGQLTRTLVNPYSGETVIITGVYNLNNASYDGAGGYDVLSMGSDNDALFIESNGLQVIRNIEQINASLGNDAIILSSLTFAIAGMTILGSLGNDILWANHGGNFVLNGSSGFDHLVGAAGNDRLLGGNDDDYLNGGTGADLIQGDDGNDTLKYTADAVWGAGFALSDSGGPFANGPGMWWELNGYNRSYDTFEGGEGYDLLILTGGNDALFLDDPISARHVNTSGARIVGIEEINAGGGHDIVDIRSATYAYAAVTISGGDGDDRLYGGSGDDTLYGNNGDDSLFGGAGNDILVGGNGGDRLDGGAGADWLQGGIEDDLLMAYTVDSVWEAGFSLSVNGGPVATSDNSLLSLEGYNRSYDTFDGGSGWNGLSMTAGNDALFLDDAISLRHASTSGARLIEIDEIFAGSGDDIIDLRSSVYTLSGAREIFGQAGNDMVYGSVLSDAIEGGEGNDRLNGGLGADRMMGEEGNDTLIYTADAVWGAGYSLSATGGPVVAPDGTLPSLEGYNRSYDTFDGGSGFDVLLMSEGNDALFIGDSLPPLHINVRVRIVGIEEINAGGGNDIVDLRSATYTYGNVTVLGGAGNDRIYGHGGHDILNGDAGHDDIWGGSGNDFIYGGAGQDYLNGGNDRDTLYGEGSADRLRGDAGDDFLYGGSGDDDVRGGTGNDNLNGDDGIDNLRGESGNDFLSGGRGDDTVKGDDGYDTLFGGEGEDYLGGGDENDKLHGGTDDDRLYGGNGDDHLYGEAGNDYISGDAGADAFHFGADDLGGRDIVKDLNLGEGDFIVLDDLLQGFDPLQDAINEFVRITQPGEKANLYVDVDGAAGSATWTILASFENVSGLNVQNMYENGQIQVSSASVV